MKLGQNEKEILRKKLNEIAKMAEREMSASKELITNLDEELKPYEANNIIILFDRVDVKGTQEILQVGSVLSKLRTYVINSKEEGLGGNNEEVSEIDRGED
jgi:CII-binding regulator of phage lambda lysogenization HflD